MPKDHFIPAAVLGEFSADSSGRLRQRRVAVQRREGDAFMTRAENVGYVPNLYGASGSVDRWVDETWTDIEQNLPAAIRQLELGGPLPANVWLRTLVPYVATLFVRGHEWEDRYMKRFQDAWGRETLREGDGAPDETSEGFKLAAAGANGSRIIELQRVLALVTCARWVVCHVTPPLQFLTNDLGLTGTADLVTGQVGWIVPLSSTVGVGIFPAVWRDVLTWSGEDWFAQIEHVYPDASTFDGLKEAIAAAARQFVVGRDLESVASVVDSIGALEDHRPLVEGWGFTSAERRANEFHWHRLAAYVQSNPLPTQDTTTLLPVLFDMRALAAGWCPRMIFGVNTTPREAGLYERDGVIRMSLRGG
ncbi:hypothetical protein [Leifsonia sp. 2MCAF36]|uniref:hypothetical protein n=1 Tax=Leifsonia sp. 2MCAF36 TaxID=3232988 RepID=UPI003F9537DC